MERMMKGNAYEAIISFRMEKITSTARASDLLCHPVSPQRRACRLAGRADLGSAGMDAGGGAEALPRKHFVTKILKIVAIRQLSSLFVLTL